MLKKHNDYTVLFLALLAAFIFVYFVPAVLNRILFFIFIYLFYKSDRDYLWIAFIFIIMESPGGLFGLGLRNDEMRMPIYTLAPGFSVTFDQIFIFTALVKAIKKHFSFQPVHFIRKKLFILLIYFIFLVIIGLILGFDLQTANFVYRTIITLTLFYSVYCLFKTESDYVNFFRILIPFGFIAFGLQLYNITVGHPVIIYLKPSASYSGSYSLTSDDIRPFEMSHIVALLFFFSFYFMLHKKEYFKKNILITLNIICFFSIIITATRSWVIMFVIFYLLSFIFISGKIGNMLMKYSIAGIVSIVLIFSIDVFVNQLNRALVRISTLEYIAEGDITGGGTILRYDVRAPAVMEAFLNTSTIVFGAGFSKTYYEHADGHVGFHNLLFNTGIVGVLLFAVFFGSIILNPLSINRKLSERNPYKDVLKIFPIIIVSIMFVNTGTQFIGYDVDFSRMLLLVFVIYFLNNQLSCAVRWEEES